MADQNHDSKAQQQHERENDARRNNEDRVPGIDKKLNGPNRPST
ncbi:hypothetical protein [Paenibacillus thermotolerans]|nr:MULTISPECIES: hypothetical protein [unclassified Paenibacillus]